MMNQEHSKKLLFGAALLSLLICAAAVYLHVPTHPATEPASEPVNSLLLNSVEPAPAACPLLEEPHRYVCGAVLYQSPAISSYFPDGGSLGSITRQNDLLTVTDGTGEMLAFSLAEHQTYSLEGLKQHFSSAFMSGELETFSSLFPADTENITHFIYQNTGESEQRTIHLWEVTSASGRSCLWMGDISVRLYALIDLLEVFPFFANGALWTYDPNASTAVPLRFELDGPVTVTAGRLSRSITEEPVGELTVQDGETIYWWPSKDGVIRYGTALEYRFQQDAADAGITEQRDKLEFRSAMCCEGLYGSKTYGISNNWLGAASSAIHLSALHVDAETGELVVELCENFPYATGIHGAGCIRGRHTPPEITDAANTAHHGACREDHVWKNCF